MRMRLSRSILPGVEFYTMADHPPGLPIFHLARPHECRRQSHEDHPLSRLRNFVVCCPGFCQRHGHQPEEWLHSLLASCICGDGDDDYLLEGRCVDGYLCQ